MLLFTPPDLWMQTFCNFGEWMGGISHSIHELQENNLNSHLQYVAKDVGYARNAHAQVTSIGWHSLQF